MELLSMKCPNCSGDINYKHGKTSCKCPYCDSVIKITMTAEEREFERINSKIANERPKYLSAMKKWRIMFYISLVLAVLSGALMLVSKSTLLSLPAVFFFIAAAPVMRLAAPDVPSVLEDQISKKDRALSTGKLYGIYIGLCFLGFLAADEIAGKPSDTEKEPSAAVAVQTDSCGRSRDIFP